jgi:EmrB/QacA subfamily drug resistance transporter
VTPDAGARPGEPGPADGSGPRELLRYRSAQGRWVVAAMILESSVAGIDSTVVAVALPAIGRNLHAGFQDLQWTVTGYTLTLASLILLAGSLSDRWGRRRVFLAGLTWFTLASVLCAAAPGIGWLIAARAVQGIGGALMTPASLAIIEATIQPGDRTHAIGTWAGFSGVSSAIAPFLGGWLLVAGSWRWIFLINVPVAAVTAWTTLRHVPESRNTSLSGGADWPGALAGVVALAAITYAIIALPRVGALSPFFAAAAVLALLSSATFAVIERRRSHPMLPPAIFAPAQFRAANAVTFVVNGALGGFAFVFIPALEIIAGYSPVVAGSALVPVTAVTLLLSGASGQLAQRIGPRPQLVAGCLLCAVASMLAVRIGPHANYWTEVFPLAVLFGLGLASLLPPLTASAMNSAPRLPGGSGLRGEQRCGAGSGPALDRRAAAHHRPHRCGLHRPGAVPVQLRSDQLDLRGSVRLRRGARRNLHHRARPAHPGTAVGARSNSGTPPHLPGRFPSPHRNKSRIPDSSQQARPLNQAS